MAELKVEGDEVVVELSALEKGESLHGNLRFPRASVRAVEVLDDAHGELRWRGLKAPGTRIPGVVEVGTFRLKDRKIFAAVHHDTPRGVRVLLDGANYDELVVGCADPESVAALLPPAP